MSEIELTPEEMAVAVALCRTFRGQRIYDDTARQMTAALRVANWVHRPTLAQEPVTCPDCLGDPDTVCDACGQHSCWEGEYMCHEALAAGTTTRVIWAERMGITLVDGGAS